MENRSIDLAEKLSRINEHWSPKVIASLNDYHLKLAKIQGEFVWHSHEETDEAFYVLQGEMTILLRTGAIHLGRGELFVVPRGVEHKTVAEAECHILLIEPAGTVNTGDAGGPLTTNGDVWI
jgi:mannose-6-phosphate isomerase-like protein (cupin superfamily)